MRWRKLRPPARRVPGRRSAPYLPLLNREELSPCYQLFTVGPKPPNKIFTILDCGAIIIKARPHLSLTPTL